MFGSWVLEVAIGLIFVFLLFSTICAAIREGIESWMKTRAAYLERGVREMLHDLQGTGLAKEFYEHPLILSLYAARSYQPGDTDNKIRTFAQGGQLPSYIPAKNFAAALIDIAARGPLPALVSGANASDPALAGGQITAQSLRSGIAAMQNKRVARALLNALDLAQDDLNRTRHNIEAWYDGSMDRVSGWYKRSTQWIVFGLALIMAGVLNVDAIGIANFLYRNDDARHAVVAQAEAAVADVRASDAGAQAAAAQQALDALPGTGPETDAAARAREAVAAATAAKEAALAEARVTRARADAARMATAPPGTLPPTPAPGNAPSATTATTNQQYDRAKAELEGLDLPIGWPAGFACHAGEKRGHCAARGGLIVVGWLLTALAATLGAPFWFDILNKVMVIRSTVKPYEKSKPEGSEDRQNTDQSLALMLRQVTAAPAPAGAMALAGGSAAGAGAATPDPEADIDGCEPGHGLITEDAELPPGDGGVLR
jgi:hypothetical protein